MKVIVCGGRDYTDEAAAFAALDRAHAKRPITLVISGGAKGADALGEVWAQRNNIHCARVPAIWHPVGSSLTDRSAGPKRNVAMMTLHPDAVIAFPGGTGTAHMADLGRRHGITVWEPYL